ncbi:BA14K family protein [Shinella zoogloeoides]
MGRYSSYRIENNTYQPFEGARKQCRGPPSQSARISVQIATVETVTQS